MRLTELHPQWVDLGDFKQLGVIFDCPVHRPHQAMHRFLFTKLMIAAGS